jgi:hypothetical protein
MRRRVATRFTTPGVAGRVGVGAMRDPLLQIPNLPGS